jgi:UDP-GlcNAc:undecaprenyl-phosphate GlcNAc-1-phosphate transferase
MDLVLDLGAARNPVSLCIAFGMSLYFTPVIRRGAISYGVLDHPNTALKKHTQATPYLGGVAIYLSFLFALAFSFPFTKEVLGILLGASIVVSIGLFDDLKVLSPRVKLAGQVVAALVLIKSDVYIKLSFIPEWAALILSVLWLVGVTNAINLIDVSDGLAAGVSSIAGLFLYVVALENGDSTVASLVLPLVGATLGFLAYNRPPARIFMGDTGSMFLGFMLAALAMLGRYTVIHRHLAAVAPVIILGVPIFDTFFVMGARAIRGIPLMRGSPDHFAVRLRNHGVPAGKIALFSYAVSTLLGILAVLLCRLPREAGYGIVGFVLLLALGAVLVLWKLGRGPQPPKPTPPSTGDQAPT